LLHIGHTPGILLHICCGSHYKSSLTQLVTNPSSEYEVYRSIAFFQSSRQGWRRSRKEPKEKEEEKEQQNERG
jgi:glutamine amidotransferase-like uncharacterized protein